MIVFEADERKHIIEIFDMDDAEAWSYCGYKFENPRLQQIPEKNSQYFCDDCLIAFQRLISDRP